jgi:hypothetical protein
LKAIDRFLNFRPLVGDADGSVPQSLPYFIDISKDGDVAPGTEDAHRPNDSIVSGEPHDDPPPNSGVVLSLCSEPAVSTEIFVLSS